MDFGTIYGRLGRLGVITIFGGEVVIADFYRHLHPDIEIAELQVPLETLTPAGLKKMSEQVGECAAQFGKYRPVDAVLFSCTSGSMIGGPGYDETLCDAIKDAAGAKQAYTTTTAVRMALKALGSKKLSIVTPYPDDVNQTEKDFFEKQGYLIHNIDGIQTKDPRNPVHIMKLEPEAIYRFALEHTHPDSDTLFLSCTGLTAFGIIDALERRLGIPVITSNQCAAWAVGKHFGYHGPDAYRLGTLFSR